VCDPVLVALLIVQLIAFADDGWRVLNAAPLRYLGRISYSIYLYQQIVSGVIESLLKGLPFPVQLSVYVVAVTVVASASYWIVERPFLVLKDRIGRRVHGAAVREPRLTIASA
jgi:peptidoglycan/LPS O-acetylase OafA/YrhL